MPQGTPEEYAAARAAEVDETIELTDPGRGDNNMHRTVEMILQEAAAIERLGYDLDEYQVRAKSEARPVNQAAGETGQRSRGPFMRLVRGIGSRIMGSIEGIGKSGASR